ncbi:hypothetical protein GCM10009830_22220 [Glycomyces endophyticus]|uniref:DUF4878 domain-containing protein n=1 Tax=Glycomyces endophyticus TaxID=480996 RepID=A0ABP4SNL3_9ACTN
MTDRDPARPDRDADAAPDAAAGEPIADQTPPLEHTGSRPAPELGDPPERTDPGPELVEHLDPPLEPIPDLAPAPEPEAPAQHAPEPIEVESHTSVEAVAEPAAPAQLAPESGAAPIPFEPEPSVPEPAEAPAASDPGTADTLALPPTTLAVEPPAAAPSAPPPPTGVPVPFAAPPTERNGAKLALKLGFGIGGGVLLSAAVIIAVVVAFVTFANSISDEVQDTAAEFVGELADEDWDAAYAMLCEDLRERPAGEYVPEWESWDPASAEVQPLAFDDVDVRVRLADGSEIAIVVQVDQTAESLGTSVCGWYDVE